MEFRAEIQSEYQVVDESVERESMLSKCSELQSVMILSSKLVSSWKSLKMLHFQTAETQ